MAAMPGSLPPTVMVCSPVPLPPVVATATGSSCHAVAGDRMAHTGVPMATERHALHSDTLFLPPSLPLSRSLSLSPFPPFLFPHLPFPLSPPPPPLSPPSPSLSLSPHLFSQNRQTSNDRPVDVSRQTDTGPHPTPAHTPPDEHISSHFMLSPPPYNPLPPSLPPSIPASLPPSLDPCLPPSIPASLTLSLPPSLNPSLDSCLPHSDEKNMNLMAVGGVAMEPALSW